MKKITPELLDAVNELLDRHLLDAEINDNVLSDILDEKRDIQKEFRYIYDVEDEEELKEYADDFNRKLEVVKDLGFTIKYITNTRDEFFDGMDGSAVIVFNETDEVIMYNYYYYSYSGLRIEEKPYIGISKEITTTIYTKKD